MPWKIFSLAGARLRLCRALLRGEQSAEWVARSFGVSRKTAYKWLKRFTAGGQKALGDRSRRPRRSPKRIGGRLIERIKVLRRKHRFWGAKKIRVYLQGRGIRVPAERTIARWLERLRLIGPRRRRPRTACWVNRPALTVPTRVNEVWTVDFKGWFRTSNGQRAEPLTVRDGFSRYGLAVRLLANQRWAGTRTVFCGLFRRYGLPKIIRTDNGGPFASTGPGGLSRLSAWWIRLGIQVEFIAPGHPEQNGSHEQFHRVLKRETTRPATRTRRGQQHRMTRWLKSYNEMRPHEALGQKVPAAVYQASPVRMPKQMPELRYAEGWRVRQVRSNGEIKWEGRKRFVGEAFVGQTVGLKRLASTQYAVYFGKMLIGHLHSNDPGAMRPAIYVRHRTPQLGAKV